jgi:hypothetical protein
MYIFMAFLQDFDLFARSTRTESIDNAVFIFRPANQIKEPIQINLFLYCC